ncbi:hypothetical protein BX616_001656 [Lobosporangium transversale]|uniref:LysM domain-containing protein n=1 Tax=Lobosporangium transversale TaxID=64571 RepID=A0A1Y2GP49_9FUNG|nr:hypothetical protein BCR41DRAFT_352550 [Lobosporangium transversale]KAF9903362.1 hypothetical protein BX616_001656 [Lobosporangium transversale]ORZ17468.1 hypothetical protein BCR41DRAFT_352550 [Lobosporangium transversale]|eukprot:XP_021881855.1 hypothetical protein BCR41DRAFT_352550 [Lobosporangium transversale]
MKFSLSLAVLALAASQAMAVVPIPVKNCTKSIIVPPDAGTCLAFAKAHGVTFQDLQKWNEKLRDDCANLDEGQPICVSVTAGDCCLALTPSPVIPKSTTVSGAPTGAPTGVPTGAPTTAPAGVPTGAPTTAPAGTPARTSAPAGSSPSTLPSSANGNKASIVLGAAGVLLSAVYML